MGQFFQHRHGVDIKRVAGVLLESANAALAQNDFMIPIRHDVFGAHQQLFNSAHHTTFEQNRHIGLAHGIE